MEQFRQETPHVTPDAGMIDQAADAASQQFVDRWQRLVSTTNWEKGRIIHEWRSALKQSGAAVQQYSDETWAARVGGVSSQHVGRLRRVYERFASQREAFPNLFWSHFLAALDWDDAEMWLEGAVQSDWSVAQMREQRWETLGAVEADRPQDGDVVASESNEDMPADWSADESPAAGQHAAAEDANAALDEAAAADEVVAPAGAPFDVADDLGPGEPMAVRPFADLPELPSDLAEAFEAFKLVILRHKVAGWSEISQAEMLTVVDSLRELVTAPSGSADGAL